MTLQQLRTSTCFKVNQLIQSNICFDVITLSSCQLLDSKCHFLQCCLLLQQLKTSTCFKVNQLIQNNICFNVITLSSCQLLVPLDTDISTRFKVSLFTVLSFVATIKNIYLLQSESIDSKQYLL